MKKVMLESLEIADLRKFREIFRYHLNNGDNCTGWWQFVPKDFWAPIRRRLQDMRDPSTQLNKYTVAAAAGWRDIGVIQCLDDLINAIALPAVAGLPLTTALGVLPFEDKLLDVHYYESVETILTATYKKYGKDYEIDRTIEDLSITKALHKSFKAVESGRIVANLIAQDDPQQKGYIPRSVGAYVDAAARHASKKAELDHSARLYQDSTWNGGASDTSVTKRPRQQEVERLCTGCGGRKHKVADCLFSESRWFNHKPGLAFINSDKGKEYFSKFGYKYLRMRDVVRNVRDNAQSQSRRTKRKRVTVEDEVSVQSRQSNRSAERDRSYSLDSRHSRDSQSRDAQGNRDRRLGYNADSRKNRDRERDRGRERTRDSQ
jgi:hypothetical protein